MRERAGGVGPEPDRLRMIAGQPGGDGARAGAHPDRVGDRVFGPQSGGKLEVGAEVERAGGARRLPQALAVGV